jgi:hypothetical protein
MHMATSKTKSPRQAQLPPQPDDFVVSVRGRQVGWLSRLLGLVAILGWWLKRPACKDRSRRYFS